MLRVERGTKGSRVSWRFCTKVDLKTKTPPLPSSSFAYPTHRKPIRLAHACKLTFSRFSLHVSAASIESHSFALPCSFYSVLPNTDRHIEHSFVAVFWFSNQGNFGIRIHV